MSSPTPTPLWQAPHCTQAFDATLSIPGSKSMTNRAFILSALADQPSTIRGALRSRDTDLMAQALRSLGAEISTDDTGTFHITPAPFHSAHIDCGLAGTVMRFVPPVAAFAQGEVVFDGDEQARSRPMTQILHGLTQAGVTVSGDRLPFSIHGTGCAPGGTVEIDASHSSQFVSGLLLSGARFEQGLSIKHIGNTLPSMPHIDMSIAMLEQAGVHVDHSVENQWHVSPGTIAGREWVIEPDLSNATPFLAAAAISQSRVRIRQWPTHTTQAGDRIRPILDTMGAKITLHNGTLTVEGTGSLRGIDLDMSDIGELTPTVAALAVFADSPTTLRGIAHLRGHETDRLAALCTEINKIGGVCTELDDGLYIEPTHNYHGAQWHSYADHRMATAGAIIGLGVPNMTVEDIETTAKTLPDFAAMWEQMMHG
ncbi:3-phosphoshikimate 1-carboxyvinyltransferase [Corynebacterium sp. sy017]|uniref:3-phosphoshikimate 1-carboxyvinyltransferase n=1 Tax=unclassified Corynebacterium TaxID=2624378 RepID=UPI0011846FF3|nr:MULTISPECIES: 3-phosphoshikimate 1-carboxyvinyltransferase [unclassified Corynebacterium]MBP3088745.1 3-phosphoshikimate 1-carboxyvinyltransferase [Corynebacterium sp. sy017]TSD92026.1 3-phosphoshikimate 1-carboxyvinyltransferase [Corynebacterium sp. SY003]